MQKISTCLWFDTQAEVAAEFYASVFTNTSIGSVAKYDKPSAEVSGQPEGSVLTVEFTIEDHEFLGLNGGPAFQLNPSISFFVNCKTATELDELWIKLVDDGKVLLPVGKYPFSERYGWLQDKFGVSWQLLLAPGEIDQKIIPSLLFVGDNCGRAEEAIDFYTAVFKRAKKGSITRYEAGQEPDQAGTVAYGDFELEGLPFAVMDSAQDHQFSFSEAVSFVVNCASQSEVDHYWDKLSAVPEAEQCGWLKDKFGVSWQIVPTALPRLLGDPDPEKSSRVMEAMLEMKKIDVAKLEKAYNNN